MYFRCRFGTLGGIAAACAFLVLTGCSNSSTYLPMASVTTGWQPPVVLPPGAAMTALPAAPRAVPAVGPRAPLASPQPMPIVPRALSGAARPAAPPAYVPAPSIAQPRDLKVMTFNLRVSTAFDGLNTWQMRKGMVLERIRAFDPDLLGTQEGLRGQVQYLDKQLDGYTFFGVGRNNGKTSGETCGVYFKTARFTKLDGGHFWLSTRPQKPGSKAWGAWFPRMVTWVKLQPRDGSQPFYWFNTHFDAFSSRAREESAKLLLARITHVAGSSPSIVTGDFNTHEGSTPYRTLTSQFNVSPLIDVYRAANPTPARREGTRHGFNGGKSGERIDWILASPSFQVISSSIDHTRGLLGYPSDHFPVTATLRTTAPYAQPAIRVARIE